MHGRPGALPSRRTYSAGPSGRNDIEDPGRLACWGPHRRDQEPEQMPWLRVGSVPASPGCREVQGWQGPADENSREQLVQSRLESRLLHAWESREEGRTSPAGHR